jgi:hypothetical protein
MPPPLPTRCPIYCHRVPFLLQGPGGGRPGRRRRPSRHALTPTAGAGRAPACVGSSWLPWHPPEQPDGGHEAHFSSAAPSSGPPPECSRPHVPLSHYVVTARLFGPTLTG